MRLPVAIRTEEAPDAATPGPAIRPAGLNPARLAGAAHGVCMAEKPNFVLVPEPEPAPEQPPQQPVGWLDRIRSVTDAAASLMPFGAARAIATVSQPTRPRLIFGFDATASREPALGHRARRHRCVGEGAARRARCRARGAWRLAVAHVHRFHVECQHVARSCRRHPLHCRTHAASGDPVARDVEPRRARGGLYRRCVRGIAGTWTKARRCDGAEGDQADRAA